MHAVVAPPCAVLCCVVAALHLTATGVLSSPPSTPEDLWLPQLCARLQLCGPRLAVSTPAQLLSFAADPRDAAQPLPFAAAPCAVHPPVCLPCPPTRPPCLREGSTSHLPWVPRTPTRRFWRRSSAARCAGAAVGTPAHRCSSKLATPSPSCTRSPALPAVACSTAAAVPPPPPPPHTHTHTRSLVNPVTGRWSPSCTRSSSPSCCAA